MTPSTELSFGQKAVGLTFNPSNNPDVDAVKQAAAAFIDVCNNLRTQETSKPREEADSEKIRMYSIAITEAQTAQMWAVKAVTWVAAPAA